MKLKVAIRKVETRTFTVIVDAESRKEAVRTAQKLYYEDDHVNNALNREIFDLDADDTVVGFSFAGQAMGNDTDIYPDIETFKKQ